MKNRGQSVTEFIVITPLFIMILVFMYQILYLFILKQRVEMGAYFVARAYSRETIRGIGSGGASALEQARKEILDGIQTSLRAFLGPDAEVSGEGGNKIKVTLPVMLPGLPKMVLEQFPDLNPLKLTAEAEMENEPLIYGGGRWKTP